MAGGPCNDLFTESHRTKERFLALSILTGEDPMAELSKFHELRTKTQGQLIQLINNELELGVREARQALKSADSWAFAEACYRQAKSAYANASRLVALVGEIPEQDRNQLAAKVAHLREMLEGLSVLGRPAPTGESIPALARALWKARGCPEGSAEEDWFRAERVLRSQTACVGN
jgi:hypothetical protein